MALGDFSIDFQSRPRWVHRAHYRDKLEISSVFEKLEEIKDGSKKQFTENIKRSWGSRLWGNFLVIPLLVASLYFHSNSIRICRDSTQLNVLLRVASRFMKRSPGAGRWDGERENEHLEQSSFRLVVHGKQKERLTWLLYHNMPPWHDDNETTSTTLISLLYSHHGKAKTTHNLVWPGRTTSQREYKRLRRQEEREKEEKEARFCQVFADTPLYSQGLNLLVSSLTRKNETTKTLPKTSSEYKIPSQWWRPLNVFDVQFHLVDEKKTPKVNVYRKNVYSFKRNRIQVKIRVFENFSLVKIVVD